MTIEELYQARCHAPHNLDQHLPTLRDLASQCESVTEFGTDIGFSTTAFLASGCPIVRSYDLVRTDWIDTLAELAPGRHEFHECDTRSCPVIAPTDLLFIDSDHTEAQVDAELARHGGQVRRYLVFHDTVEFPEIRPAIERYTAAGWECVIDSPLQHGLQVWRRHDDL